MRKIRSIQDLSFVAEQTNHVLTLFSGGLDSTYLLSLLSSMNIKVTALAVDLGDGIDRTKLQAITEHYGADLVVEDATEQFIESAVIPAIQAQAMYMNMYPVSSSLSRPVISRIAVETAGKLGCGAIIHTANQSQNSLRRLNGAIKNSGYRGFYGSPYEYSAITRTDKASQLSIPCMQDQRQGSVSSDSNLWCREYESGVLDNPEDFMIPESLFLWSKENPSRQITEAAHQIRITFRDGIPVSVNEQPMPLVELIKFLNIRAGAYKIGRYLGLEHLDQDEKVLEIREAPAARMLMEAYKHLEMSALPTDYLNHKLQQEQIWTMEAVEGRWGSPLQQAARAFIQSSTEKVSGSVTYKMEKGLATAISIVAREPLYLTNRDHWEIQAAQERSRRSLV